VVDCEDEVPVFSARYWIINEAESARRAGRMTIRVCLITQQSIAQTMLDLPTTECVYNRDGTNVRL